MLWSSIVDMRKQWGRAWGEPNIPHCNPPSSNAINIHMRHPSSPQKEKRSEKDGFWSSLGMGCIAFNSSAGPDSIIWSKRLERRRLENHVFPSSQEKNELDLVNTWNCHYVWDSLIQSFILQMGKPKAWDWVIFSKSHGGLVTVRTRNLSSYFLTPLYGEERMEERGEEKREWEERREHERGEERREEERRWEEAVGHPMKTPREESEYPNSCSWICHQFGYSLTLLSFSFYKVRNLNRWLLKSLQALKNLYFHWDVRKKK